MFETIVWRPDGKKCSKMVVKERFEIELLQIYELFPEQLFITEVWAIEIFTGELWSVLSARFALENEENC